MTSRQHGPPDEPVHVDVAAEHSLIVEAVRTALRGCGLDSQALPWPGVPPRPRRRPEPAQPRSVGLLLSDLKDWREARASGLVLRRRPIPWLVLTGAPEGPMWGAVYEHGARLVISDRTTLEDVVATLTALARGQRGVAAGAEQQLALRAQWHELCDRHMSLSNRARALTPREREVLILLYEGATIADIAALLQISASTVRSQVKAVRQKLGVNTQLAAVAAYGSLITSAPVRPLLTS